MLKPIYEGKLNALFRAEEVLEEGTIVALDPDNPGVVIPATDGDAFGVLAEKVVDYSGQEFNGYRSPVKPIAGVGDKVGVYNEGGTYATTNFADGTYAPGEDLFCDAGEFTNTDPTGTGDGTPIATVVEVKGDKLIFDLAL